MDKNYENKILKEIEKSGFPLELEIVEKFREAGYLTIPNFAFNSAEGSIREIDSIAIKLDEEIKEFNIGIQLIAECKKSNKYPWIFFDEGYEPISFISLTQHTDYSIDWNVIDPRMALMNTEMSGHHYNDITINRVRTYFEGFKNINEPTTIFKAVMSIYHGRKYLRDWFERTSQNKKKDCSKARIFLNKYLIVFDGKLILADKKETIFNVKETKHLILRGIDCITNSDVDFYNGELLIDVITKDYFDEYLKILSEDLIRFTKHVKRLLTFKEHNSQKK